jgi:hypothetical protein
LSSALLINLVVLAFDFSLVKVLRKIVIDKDESPIYFATGIDKLIDAVNPDGNIFLVFRGFDGESARDVASIMFFRVVYRAYPKKVFVSPQKMRIVRGTEFFELKFLPDDQSLARTGISDVIIFQRNPAGQVSYEHKKLNPRGIGKIEKF